MADRLDQQVEQLREALRAARDPVLATGLNGAARGLILSSLCAPPFTSAILISPTPERADALFEDLRFFLRHRDLNPGRVARFPAWDIPPYEWSSPVPDLVGERFAVLASLSLGEPLWVVTSVEGVLQKIMPRSALAGAVIDLRRGDAREPHTLASELIALGYTPSAQVRRVGEYSLRGGILDIFSGSCESPARVEFFGDTVESLRLFDPDTQTSLEPADVVRILPARELLLRPDDRTRAEARLRMAADRLALDPDVAAAETERLLGSPSPLGIEWLAPILHGPLESLLDYLPMDALIVFDESSACRRTAAAHLGHVEEAYVEAKAEETIVASPGELFLRREEWTRATEGGPRLELESLAVQSSSAHAVAFETRTPESLGIGLQHGPFQSTLAILHAIRSDGRVFVVGHGPESTTRLRKIFQDHDCPASDGGTLGRLEASGGAGAAPIELLEGALTSGAFIPSLRWFWVTEEELFGKTRRTRPAHRARTSVFLSSFENLHFGDLLVHLQHGIGRYGGLKTLSVAGQTAETLVMEYADRAMLYVPLDRLYEVQKYVGSGGETPSLDRLGGSTWARSKKRAKKEIETMMQEILDLYADREVVSGHAFSPDGPLSAEFDAGFDYEETPDQFQVIAEVKADMENDRPMDRLVCGDVGYGKTEVALRAAFKAVQDFRQVAILAPTTLLADQHYRTFSRRFAPFPVRVEMISRFRTTAEQRAILKDAREGKVDILIGTHRLLQKDIGLPNLGLLIIDEEQRFGVIHKERLKQVKKSVDVLTLTATPIPRTLQMALMSIRDLSIIETPPPDRLAVRTSVAEFDRRVIREAILHELERDGQIFFVHNRVQGIEKLAGLLQDIVPEARIGAAHGQMPERALEDVMLAFIRRDLDVLLCTAIIESGLDIPSANTIIINKADQFGLAELYQLRGRVGRSGRQAYAVLLVSNLAVLTGQAKDRLRAIREFAELGSGFRIAARDLEIRGAGTLLGKKQSGQIASLGFELYMQMIEEAVREHRGLPLDTEVEPVLNLGATALLPETYIPEDDQRLAVYKRLSAIRDLEGLARLEGELRDRYGPPPEETRRLIDVVSIRVHAKAIGVSRIDLDEGGAAIHLDPRHRAKGEELDRMVREARYDGRRDVRFLSEYAFKVPIRAESWEGRTEELRKHLQALR